MLEGWLSKIRLPFSFPFARSMRGSQLRTGLRGVRLGEERVTGETELDDGCGWKLAQRRIFVLTAEEEFPLRLTHCNLSNAAPLSLPLLFSCNFLLTQPSNLTRECVLLPTATTGSVTPVTTIIRRSFSQNTISITVLDFTRPVSSSILPVTHHRPKA